MKRILLGLILSVGIVSTYGQSITVESHEVEDTDYGKYKSFYWTSQVDNKLDEGHYFLDDLILKDQVREAVKGELLGLGYEMDQIEPDLLVNFRVFDEATRLRGTTEGYGDTYWGIGNVNQMDTTSYQVDAGTLLINLVDRETGTIVWNGFASGLIDGDSFIKDKGKIHEAVNMIFDDYNQRAKEYTRR